MALGVQVVIEDYVHREWVKISALVLNKLAAFALAGCGIFAVLRIAFAGYSDAASLSHHRASL